MYLPENDAQMHDILAELRLYAQLNHMHGLAEELDDAIVLLAAETRRGPHRRGGASGATLADPQSR